MWTKLSGPHDLSVKPAADDTLDGYGLVYTNLASCEVNSHSAANAGTGWAAVHLALGKDANIATMRILTFRLTDDENKSWVSKRWLHKDQKFAYASRHDPMFPLKYMKIIWLYHEQEDGVLMTWIQDFEMDPGFTKFTGEEIEGFINKHSVDNMNIFKKVIEEEAAQTANK